MPAPLPLEEAQLRLLALADPLPIERVPVAEALGRYLAEPLVARRTQPAADVSAMDGYAMRMADLPGPWRVIGESAAGHPFFGSVDPGQATRISTGALLPDGADMVLMQEDSTRDGEILQLTGTPPSPLAKHLRRCGNDFAEGKQLVAAGTRLGPAQLGLAMAAGYGWLAVRRRVRVAIIDSGDELSDDPANCPPHKVPASNGVVLAALVAGEACEIERIGPIADCLEDVIAALEAASSADVIVTSGGASVGDHDLIRPALAKWGATLDFWKVAIKPGKPLLVARRGAQLVVGLPGNPVSSMVTAHLFLLPLLRSLLGAAQPQPQPLRAELRMDLPPGGDRREFMRASWDGEFVGPVANQDSGALAGLAAANVLIDRPAQAPAATAGTRVPVYLLGNGGIA
jgi:molybdopterin molybdotransferase